MYFSYGRNRSRGQGRRPAPTKGVRQCIVCLQPFASFYKGKIPKCPGCMEDERKLERANDLLAQALRNWRQSKIQKMLRDIAGASDSVMVSVAVSLLRQPKYAYLVSRATNELRQEFPEGSDEFNSFRAYVPAPLLTTLCAQQDPRQDIGKALLALIRPLVAAYPKALVPDGTFHWTHPTSFLCRGDPLYTQCRNLMIKDIFWDPDIHPLLPPDIQQRYILLARILWKYKVYGGGAVLERIASYLPAVIDNKESKLSSCRTVLEIAHDNGVLITQSCWEEITLQHIARLMSQECTVYISVDMLPHLDFRYPDVFELDGIVGVPERRSSGNVRRTCAFSRRNDKLLRQEMGKRIYTVTDTMPKALGVPTLSKVLLTSAQLGQLKQQVMEPETAPGMFFDWFIINDATAVEEAINGAPNVDVDDPRGLFS